MIKRLIKIIYIKITKPAPRLRRSGTGTEPHPYARAMDENSTELSALAPVTMNPHVLRALYERGLIREADFIRDREERMEAARTDASRCPCGGHHYPSADACRWCRCHRFRDPVTESAVRRSDEIQQCGVCGHLHHPLTDCWRPFLPVLSGHLCGGTGQAPCADCHHGAHTDRSFCGEVAGDLTWCPCGMPDADQVQVPATEIDVTDEAVDAAWDSFLGINPDGVEGGPS